MSPDSEAKRSEEKSSSGVKIATTKCHQKPTSMPRKEGKTARRTSREPRGLYELSDSILRHFGKIQNELSVPERMHWFLKINDFFGMSSSDESPAYSISKKPHPRSEETSFIHLPSVFLNWEEWERIVISHLRALVWLEMRDIQPIAKNDSQEEKLSAFGESVFFEMIQKTGKIRSIEEWTRLWPLLNSNDGVSIEDLAKMISRLAKRLKTFDPSWPHQYTRLDAFIVRNWIILNPPQDKPPGLCGMDITGAVNWLRHRGTEILENNYSREVTKLRLIRCSKTIWTAKEVRGKSPGKKLSTR